MEKWLILGMQQELLHGMSQVLFFFFFFFLSQVHFIVPESN